MIMYWALCDYVDYKYFLLRNLKVQQSRIQDITLQQVIVDHHLEQRLIPGMQYLLVLLLHYIPYFNNYAIIIIF